MNSAIPPIIILMLEDNPADAELIERELRQGNITFVAQRVDTMKAFLDALRTYAPDIILADYRLPGFTGLDALREKQIWCPQIPLILVTGSQTEDVAVECMREGADDYLLKASLTRLPHAVLAAIERKQSHDAILAAQKELHFRASIIDTIGHAVIVTREDGTIEYWNRGAELLYGWNAHEAIGRVHRELVHTEISPEDRQHIVRELAAGHVWHGEVVRRRKNGERVPVLLTITPFRSEDGTFSGQIATSLDNTERRRMMEELAESERMKQLILDSIDDMIFSVNFSEASIFTGVLEFVNASVERHMGYSMEEFRSDPNLWFSMVHPDDAQRLTESNTGIFTDKKQSSIAFRWKSRDGAYRWVENITTPKLDTEGNVTGLFIASRDITERRMMERELNKAVSLLNATLDATGDGILAVDAGGNPSAINRRFMEMWGIPPDFVEHHTGEESLAFLANQLVDPEASLQVVRELVAHPEAESRDDIVFLDGKVFERFSCPQQIDGQIAGRVWTYVDVTQRKRNEQQMRASLAEKEVLLKEIHHRVKNNLQVISSLLNLQSSSLMDERDREMFRESQNRIRSMALVHELLYRSHDLARINVADYLRELVNSLISTYESHRDRITFSVEVEPLLLDLDTAVPCGLIVNELISNAIKYAFPGERRGRVSVLFGRDPDGILRLRVNDTGIGLSPSFDIHESAQLGLQLVTTLSEQIGATMSTESAGGAQFTFAMPKN